MLTLLLLTLLAADITGRAGVVLAAMSCPAVAREVSSGGSGSSRANGCGTSFQAANKLSSSKAA
jgi:hypothetical protein